jgi:hypothetical protein
MKFLIQCVLLHTGLIAYFWLASWYTQRIMKNLPEWAQALIGIAYLLGLLIPFLRKDLITLNRRHNSLDRGTPISRISFYWLVFLYYAALTGGAYLLLSQKESLPSFVHSYLVFVYLVCLINWVDYGIPSYRRYARLGQASSGS